MFYRLLNIDKSEPKIVRLENPIRVVGVSRRTDTRRIYKDAARLAKSYKAVKTRNIVKSKKEPWAFAAISANFSNDGKAWDYIMGDVVESFDDQIQELVTYEIPAKQYAVFTIAPKCRLLWGPVIGLTKKFISANGCRNHDTIPTRS